VAGISLEHDYMAAARAIALAGIVEEFFLPGVEVLLDARQ